MEGEITATAEQTALVEKLLIREVIEVELKFQSFILEFKGPNVPEEQKAIEVKIKDLAKLFYLGKDQIEKVFLFSLGTTIDGILELD